MPPWLLYHGTHRIFFGGHSNRTFLTFSWYPRVSNTSRSEYLSVPNWTDATGRLFFSHVWWVYSAHFHSRNSFLKVCIYHHTRPKWYYFPCSTQSIHVLEELGSREVASDARGYTVTNFLIHLRKSWETCRLGQKHCADHSTEMPLYEFGTLEMDCIDENCARWEGVKNNHLTHQWTLLVCSLVAKQSRSLSTIARWSLHYIVRSIHQNNFGVCSILFVRFTLGNGFVCSCL